MSISDNSHNSRFLSPETTQDGIAAEVENMLEESHLALLDSAGEWEWSVDIVDISTLEQSEELIPKRNAALRERSRAQARVQLSAGFAPPLVVVDDNLLIDGHTRVSLLEEFGETTAVVYRGTPITAFPASPEEIMI